jgi:acyl-CoA carboxylase subunit beta
VDSALEIISSSPPRATPPAPSSSSAPRIDLPAWHSVTASRHPDRPGVRELLSHAATDLLMLNGTGQGENDPGLILTLARFDETPCVLLGQDRHSKTSWTPLGPGALRKARRGMRLAADLDLPLVSVIDTAGAALSREAEEGGLAGEIARCIADMVALEVPTVSVLLGQGTGGAALALVPADRVLAAQHGWLAPLPPEGASAILYHHTGHAPDLANRQGVRSADLFAHNIVDRVIPEYPDAAEEPEPFCQRVGVAIRKELMALASTDVSHRLAERARRFDRIGQGDPFLAQAV